MDAPAFLITAIDPDAWLAKSASLRRSGDRLWDSFFEMSLHWATRMASDEKKAGLVWTDAAEYLVSSKFMYGLSLETALKAHFLRQRPADIEFRLMADGTGAIQSAELKQFGIQMGSGHNLEQLAQRLGLFTLAGHPVFKLENDITALREILKHLSEVVYWSGRYPVPTKSGETHQPPPDIPAKVFGHYIRDWIDPLLDHLQGAYAPPDDFNERMAEISARVKTAHGRSEA